jgi:hypothetical protein
MPCEHFSSSPPLWWEVGDGVWFIVQFWLK